MTPEKHITIRLLDGEADGLKTATLSGWNGQALIIPKDKFKDISELDNCEKPAVYFLFNKRKNAYIGETTNLKERLEKHVTDQRPWHTAIGFISQTGEINKAHVMELERECIVDSKKIGRYKIDNRKIPTEQDLSSQDYEIVVSFLGKLKKILTSIEYPILQPRKDEGDDQTENQNSQNKLVCEKKNGARGSGYKTDKGNEFFVFQGSTIAEPLPSLEKSDLTKFTNLLDGGKLKLLDGKQLAKENGKLYELIEDFTFTSPSSAASIILGRNANGWVEWKRPETNKKLRDIYHPKN